MISLVIPLYNEQNNAPRLISCLDEFLKEIDFSLEVILVDDGSVDETYDIILKSRYIVLGYKRNMGKGYAVRYGIEHAKGDYIFFTDADLAYGLDILKLSLEEFKKNNCDMVIASRNINKKSFAKYTFKRKIMSKTYSFIVKNLLEIGASDTQCGFKGFKGTSILEILPFLQINGFAFDVEILHLAYKKGMNVREIEGVILNHDQSSINPVKDSIKMLREILQIKKIHKG